MHMFTDENITFSQKKPCHPYVADGDSKLASILHAVAIVVSTPIHCILVTYHYLHWHGGGTKTPLTSSTNRPDDRFLENHRQRSYEHSLLCVVGCSSTWQVPLELHIGVTYSIGLRHEESSRTGGFEWTNCTRENELKLMWETQHLRQSPKKRSLLIFVMFVLPFIRYSP